MNEAEDLRVAISTFENLPLVTLRGEWDIAGKELLHDALLSLDTDRDVLVDLREASFFDSSALGELIALHRRLASQGHRVETLVGNSNMRRLLELTSLEDLLGVSPQREHYLAERIPPASSLLS
jgi:anti-sigma B factor antagonist